jgi:hypothetical protein
MLIAMLSMMCAGANAAGCEQYDVPTTTLSGIVIKPSAESAGSKKRKIRPGFR